MPSKELIEKVARALFEAIDETTYKSKEDGDAWCVVDGEVNFHTQAQAAISTILAALQEPTEGMLDVCGDQWCYGGALWKRMLNASALRERE